MPHLLSVWPKVSRCLRDAHRVLLLLDYDGTLSPIVDRPGSACLPAGTRESLLELCRQEKYIVGIITARSLEDITGRVGVEELVYAGNHGLEMRGPGLESVHHQAARISHTANRVDAALQQALGGTPGVLIENKGLTLTVHYRLTPKELVPEVKEAVAGAVRPFIESGLLTTSPGKLGIEIRPDVCWDKGKALSKLRMDFPQASPTLYFGDDFPDEAAFAAAQDSGGLGVFVGPDGTPTTALHRLDSPLEVGEALRRMADL